MNERAEERAPVRERGRKTKETKEASAEGWTVVEGGNEETNKKSRVAAVSHFAWSSNREGQCDGQRGSATMKSPPSPTSREKIDRYSELFGNRSDDGSDGDVQREDSCVAQGWRSRGQRKEGEQRERYPILDEVDGGKQPGHSLPEYNYNGHTLLYYDYNSKDAHLSLHGIVHSKINSMLCFPTKQLLALPSSVALLLDRPSSPTLLCDANLEMRRRCQPSTGARSFLHTRILL